jgi:hypothetical protein
LLVSSNEWDNRPILRILTIDDSREAARPSLQSGRHFSQWLMAVVHALTSRAKMSQDSFRGIT